MQQRDKHKKNKGAVLKNCAPFTDCMNKINNAQSDNEKDPDVVMAMYNLMECRNNYWKISGSLW